MSAHTAQTVFGKSIASIMNGTGHQKVIPWDAFTRRRALQMMAAFRLEPWNLLTVTTLWEGAQVRVFAVLCRSCGLDFPGDPWFNTTVHPALERLVRGLFRTLGAKGHIGLYRLPGGQEHAYWPEDTRRWGGVDWDGSMVPAVTPDMRRELERVAEGYPVPSWAQARPVQTQGQTSFLTFHLATPPPPSAASQHQSHPPLPAWQPQPEPSQPHPQPPVAWQPQVQQPAQQPVAPPAYYQPQPDAWQPPTPGPQTPVFGLGPPGFFALGQHGQPCLHTPPGQYSAPAAAAAAAAPAPAAYPSHFQVAGHNNGAWYPSPLSPGQYATPAPTWQQPTSPYPAQQPLLQATTPLGYGHVPPQHLQSPAPQYFQSPPPGPPGYYSYPSPAGGHPYGPPATTTPPGQHGAPGAAAAAAAHGQAVMMTPTLPTPGPGPATTPPHWRHEQEPPTPAAAAVGQPFQGTSRSARQRAARRAYKTLAGGESEGVGIGIGAGAGGEQQDAECYELDAQCYELNAEWDAMEIE